MENENADAVAEPESLSVRSGGDAIAKSGLLTSRPDETASGEETETEGQTEIVEASPEHDEDLDTASPDDDSEDEFDDEDEAFEEDDEGEGDPDDSDDSESPAYTVKVDGEECEVTLEEALSGYQRQADYTRKSMALAEQRRELQDAAEEVITKQTEYDERLDLVEQVLQQQVPDDVDWAEVKRNRPKEYRALRDQYEENKEALENIQAERQRAREEAQQLLARQREQVVQVEQDKLHAAIPEWSDPETKQEEVKQIVDTATSYGFAPKDVEDIVDHRLVLLLRDAMQWRTYQGNKADAKSAARKSRKKDTTLKPGSPDRKTSKKSRKKSKDLAAAKSAARKSRKKDTTLKPGSPDRKTSKKSRKKSKDLAAAKKRLRETGNVADAAEALSGLI